MWLKWPSQVRQRGTCLCACLCSGPSVDAGEFKLWYRGLWNFGLAKLSGIWSVATLALLRSMMTSKARPANFSSRLKTLGKWRALVCCPGVAQGVFWCSCPTSTQPIHRWSPLFSRKGSSAIIRGIGLESEAPSRPCVRQAPARMRPASGGKPGEEGSGDG